MGNEGVSGGKRSSYMSQDDQGGTKKRILSEDAGTKHPLRTSQAQKESRKREGNRKGRAAHAEKTESCIRKSGRGWKVPVRSQTKKRVLFGRLGRREPALKKEG